jgi:hypothetical protein
MPRRLVRRAVPSVVLLALVVAPLAACGSGDGTDDEAQDFCDAGEEAFSELEATGALGDDPEAFAAAVTELHEGFASLQPPEEIAADWSTFTAAFGDLDDALQSIDLSDEDAFAQALTDFSEQAESDEITTASDSISTYLSANCEA